MVDSTPRRLGSAASGASRGCSATGLRRRLHLVSGEQQPVAVEERPAVGPPHDLEQRGSLAQASGEPLGRVLGQLRRRAVDHDHGQPLQRRERRS